MATTISPRTAAARAEARQELKSHIERALGNGVTREEIDETKGAK